jgi:hypothetical protein
LTTVGSSTCVRSLSMSMRASAGDRRAIHATPFHTGKGAQTGTATALLHDQLTAKTIAREEQSLSEFDSNL